jgi:hypothetical protein
MMSATDPKPKKKRVNSKAKGSGFEAKLAKQLSVALDPLKFVRTQGSGGRVGGKNFETIGQMFGQDALKLFVGDIVPSNEKDTLNGESFAWSIEAKFYKTPDSMTSIISGTANFFGWFNESRVDAVKIERKPLLIFKWNNTAIYVAALVDDIPEGFTPSVTISRDGLSYGIFFFEELLAYRNFWLREEP